jgi:hypothetical protein
MLRNYFIKYSFYKFIQSGFLLDFIVKKIAEIFIRNFFVYCSIFFGEKYLIEYLTRKFLNNILYNFNKNYLNNTNYSKFFLELLLLNFYLLFLIYYIIFFI